MRADTAAFKRRKAAVIAYLRDTHWDEHGTPNRKMPECPRCEEDELYRGGYFGRRVEVRCYLCRISLEFTQTQAAWHGWAP